MQRSGYEIRTSDNRNRNKFPSRHVQAGKVAYESPPVPCAANQERIGARNKSLCWNKRSQSPGSYGQLNSYKILPFNLFRFFPRALCPIHPWKTKKKDANRARRRLFLYFVCPASFRPTPNRTGQKIH